MQRRLAAMTAGAAALVGVWLLWPHATRPALRWYVSPPVGADGTSVKVLVPAGWDRQGPWYTYTAPAAGKPGSLAIWLGPPAPRPWTPTALLSAMRWETYSSAWVMVKADPLRGGRLPPPGTRSALDPWTRARTYEATQSCAAPDSSWGVYLAYVTPNRRAFDRNQAAIRASLSVGK